MVVVFVLLLESGGERNRVYGSLFRVARKPDLFRRSTYVSVLFRRTDQFCYILAAIGKTAVKRPRFLSCKRNRQK
jgi:hypothetical protein